MDASWRPKTAWLLALGLALLPGALRAGVEAEESSLQLFVRQQEAALRAQPRLDAKLVDELPYGAELRKLRIEGGWYEVEDPATGNRGWIRLRDVGESSPVLRGGFENVRWGQSPEEVSALVGVESSATRLVERRAQGPYEAVAYNFHADRLWFVEVRFRAERERSFETLVPEFKKRYGEPHERGSHKWQLPRPGGRSSVLMATEFCRWNTGVTGLALVSYSPLYEEGGSEVRMELWSVGIARELGYGEQPGLLEELDL